MVGVSWTRVGRDLQPTAGVAEFELFADDADSAHPVAADGRPECRADADERDPPQAKIFGRNARNRRGTDSRGVAKPADCAVDHLPSLKALRVIPAPT